MMRIDHPFCACLFLLVFGLSGCSKEQSSAGLKTGIMQSADAQIVDLGTPDTSADGIDDPRDLGPEDRGMDLADVAPGDDLDTSIAEDPRADVFDAPDLPPIESGEHILSHDGIDRTFVLYVPDNLPAGAPLVYVMHGYTNSPADIITYAGFREIADTHGVVVCYPRGTVDEWGYHFFSVGYEFHQNTAIDDVGFIRALNRHLQARLDLSSDHVFATGMSNGGEMSYLLACQASDLFAAIAPVAATMMKSFFDTCFPTQPMPVFAIHGTQDNITLYDGNLNDTQWGPYQGIPSIISFWSQHNGLSQIETKDLEDSRPSDGSTISFDRHYQQGSSTEVWLYRVDRGGHDWPGAWGNLDIESSEEIWRFFSQYLN